MSNVRKPQSPDVFPKEFGEVVEEAYRSGSHFVECSTEREAQSLKFQFIRFLKSVPFYKPDTDLAHKCLMVKVKINSRFIEIVNKEMESSTMSLRKSLGVKSEKSLDPAAKSIGSLEEEFEELRRMEATGTLPPPEVNQE